MNVTSTLILKKIQHKHPQVPNRMHQTCLQVQLRWT